MTTQTPNISVPDHILDLVADTAKAYVVESRDRWLGGFSEEDAAAVFERSTHHLVDTPERRELHRAILQEVAQSIKAESSGKPIFIYVAGPMAAGKSALQEAFKERMQSEDPHQLFEDPNMEAAYQEYATASQRLMASDFALYKQRLPEFEENGNEYAVIRAEASGLDYAVTTWARELKVNMVREDLGDGVDEAWLNDVTSNYDLVYIGVTADPHVNAARLHARNEATGEQTKDTELAKTIRGFSSDNAYNHMAQNASRAILVHADQDMNMHVIHAAKDGWVVADDEPAYERFLSYRNLTDQQLAKPAASSDADGQSAPGLD